MIAVRPTEAVRVNLVDDHAEAYDDIVQALGSDGYKVTTYTKVCDVTDEQIEDCSLWVIDKRFGSKTSGLALLKKLKNLPDKRIIMLTGYPVAADKIGHVTYDEALNNLSVVIQKPSSFRLESDGLTELIDQVFSAEEIDPELKLRDFRRETELELFLSLSEDEQDEIFDNVLRDHEGELEKKWASGAVWACVFGVDGDHIESVNDVRDIPNPSAVDNRSEALGLPAFEVDRSMAFHNFGCSAGNTHGGGNISTYPHVRIGVPPHETNGFHFDSGADTSLFCKNFIESCDHENVEYVSRNRRRKKVPIQTQLHHVQVVNVTATVKYRSDLRDHASKAELDKGVTIPGLSVKNWKASDLVAKCSDECKNAESGQNCVFRSNGLIGRDFYMRNNLKIVLSFENTEADVIPDQG